MGFDKGIDVVNAFPNEVKNKIFLLTGPNPGELAATTAEALAHGDAGALILVGKSQDVAKPVMEGINRKFPKVKLIFITADFTRLDSVRSAAETIRRLETPIDGIVVTPSLMAVPWKQTVDAMESHFQVNYLAHFLLVNLLVPCMSPGGTVVMVSTSIRPETGAPGYEDINFSNGRVYDPLDAYAQSMFANIQFAKSLAKSCAGRSLTAFSINPGNIRTNLLTCVSPDQVSTWLRKKRDAGQEQPLLLQQVPKSLPQASATVLRALLDPILEGQSGAFLDNCQVLALPNMDFPAGESSAKRLWELSEELVGEVFKWS
ncbi:hypothetical protein MPDQ_005429 [Monascus purpureus]|uniref:Oxidoreductase n=1 Tax=Monascus purpureus TaxID=5098 RepID=A0A507QZU4_MONPU|nr:hypothetical protein MPDQ_005429 [Monascus purpureus]BDD57832.1 hypothetical protein MAP00_003160 [Monascus purpureus]